MTDIFIIETREGITTTRLFSQMAFPVEFLQKRLEEYEVTEHCWYELERLTGRAFEMIFQLDDVYIENTDAVYFGLRPQNLDHYMNKTAGNC
jgi:hypothetical protein